MKGTHLFSNNNKESLEIELYWSSFMGHMPILEPITVAKGNERLWLARWDFSVYTCQRVVSLPPSQILSCSGIIAFLEHWPDLIPPIVSPSTGPRAGAFTVCCLRWWSWQWTVSPHLFWIPKKLEPLVSQKDPSYWNYHLLSQLLSSVQAESTQNKSNQTPKDIYSPWLYCLPLLLYNAV